MSKEKLTARPAAHDYRKELEGRFKSRALLLNMDYAGLSTDERRPYQIVNGIACIGICGVLCNDPGWWDETSYGDIQDEVSMAADDAQVKGIMLIGNTPGGETDQAFETAGVLAEAAKLKPMWAVASPIAYSAGYLLLSQAAKIYVPQITGGVGSIGVYAVHFDYSKMLQDAGIGVTIISAGAGKNEASPLAPLSDDAKARMAAEINRLYGEFVASVARGRNMPESEVVKLGAFLYEGSKASLGAGLADQAGTLDSAMADFAKHLATAAPMGSAASADSSNGKKGARMEGKDQANQLGTVAAPPPAAPTAEQLETIRAEANKTGYAAAAEVIDTCLLAGVGIKNTAGVRMSVAETAQHFINAKMPIADVRAALMAAKAEGTDANEMRGQSMPGDGAGNGGSNIETQKPAKSMKQIAEEKYRKEGLLK